MNEIKIYNGFTIIFDENKEIWFTNVDPETGQQAKYRSSDNEVSNVSLKKLKEALDIIKRKKFNRFSVFIRSSHYRLGAGQDQKYLPYYTEGTVTSVSPNGNAFIVPKGEKHGDKYNLKWNSDSIIIDTPENRKIIEKIEAEGEKKWKAEKTFESLKKKLEFIDGRKLFKQIYGKDLQII